MRRNLVRGGELSKLPEWDVRMFGPRQHELDILQHKASLAPEDAPFNAVEVDSDVVLLGTLLATGEIRVKAVVKSASAISAARAAFHKENKTHFQSDTN